MLSFKSFKVSSPKFSKDSVQSDMRRKKLLTTEKLEPTNV